MQHEYEAQAMQRRQAGETAVTMPGGMTASFAPIAVGGADADGMPVGFMNRGGNLGMMPSASPRPMSAGQQMPTGGMNSAAQATSHAPSSAVLGEMPRAGAPPAHAHAHAHAHAGAVFAEMPRAGATPGRASEPSAEGPIALTGEWRLQLTVRGQTT